MKNCAEANYSQNGTLSQKSQKARHTPTLYEGVGGARIILVINNVGACGPTLFVNILRRNRQGFLINWLLLLALRRSLEEPGDNVTYIAGLWTYRLRRGLLWRTVKTGPPQRLSFTAPSWSWASIDGSFTISDYSRSGEGLVEILEARSQLPTTSNPYGAVTSGYVRLRGPMVQAKVSKRPVSWEIEFYSDSNSDSDSDGMMPQKSIKAIIRWDDRAMECMAESLNVVLAPFEAILLDDRDLVMGLCVEGLILLSTYQCKG